MAGLVVEDVQGQDAQPAVSDRVDLPGLGVRVGWLVRLPNAGGQWEPNFNRPVVDVQVVAASEQEASNRLAELVSRVEQALDDRQAADGIPPSARIRATASVDHVRVSQLSGAPSRAAMMTLLLGLARVPGRGVRGRSGSGGAAEAQAPPSGPQRSVRV